jgi:EAL domain-containing protein (putative c-di-GMP-specific phosphodiesterase class I)
MSKIIHLWEVNSDIIPKIKSSTFEFNLSIKYAVTNSLENKTDTNIYNKIIYHIINNLLFKEINIKLDSKSSIISLKWKNINNISEKEKEEDVENIFFKIIEQNLLIRNTKITNKDLDISYNNIDFYIKWVKNQNEEEKLLQMYNQKNTNKLTNILLDNIKYILEGNKDSAKISIKIPPIYLLSNDLFLILKNKLSILEKKDLEKIIIEVSWENTLPKNDYFKNNTSELEKLWITFAIDKVTNKKVSIKEMLETVNIVLNSKDNNVYLEKSELIDYYLSKYQVNVLLKFKRKFPELFKNYNNLKIKSIWDEKEIEYYSKKDNIWTFFDVIEKNIEYYLRYEKVFNSKKSKILFEEALLRVKKDISKKFWWINHIDILYLHRYFDNDFSILKKVLDIIINDIDTNKKSFTSINLEISDIMNDDFISLITEFSKKVDPNKIIFEILEHQKTPTDNNLFTKKINILKKIWFKLVYDDVCSRTVPFSKLIENLENIWNWNIDLIKIDWLTISTLFNLYYIFWDMANPLLNDFKEKLVLLSNTYKIDIIAEFIDSEEKMIFVKDFLWINLLQWYFIQDNIKNKKKSD